MIKRAASEPSHSEANGASLQIDRVRTKPYSRCGQTSDEAETRAYAERVKAAEALEGHPALLRLAELEMLRELAQNGSARLYLGIDRVSLHGTDSSEHDS